MLAAAISGIIGGLVTGIIIYWMITSTSRKLAKEELNYNDFLNDVREKITSKWDNNEKYIFEYTYGDKTYRRRGLVDLKPLIDEQIDRLQKEQNDYCKEKLNDYLLVLSKPVEE